MIKNWVQEIVYRTKQFQQAAWAKPLNDKEWGELATLLSDSELQLFRQFRLNDQRHSYQVMTRLKEEGYEGAVLVAGLLHDIGKSVISLSIIERVLIVVMGWFFTEEQIALWGMGEPVGWKRPFVVKAQHPRWGAELAQKVGADPIIVTLIQRHQEPLQTIETEEDQLLEQLQWADNQN